MPDFLILEGYPQLHRIDSVSIEKASGVFGMAVEEHAVCSCSG
jgi:hypothetical protein